MTFARTISTSVIVLLLTQCNPSASDAFKTVDNSLKTSNTNLSSSLESLYSEIDSKRQKNPTLVLKADSVFYATEIACKFIDSIKLVMQSKDTSGTNLNVSTEMLVNSQTGNILKEKLLAVYKYSYLSLIDNSKKGSLDSVLNPIGQLQFNDNWKRIYFEMAPTVAAITILSKFQNDCKNAVVISLRDIKEHLAN